MLQPDLTHKRKPNQFRHGHHAARQPQWQKVPLTHMDIAQAAIKCIAKVNYPSRTRQALGVVANQVLNARVNELCSA